MFKDNIKNKLIKFKGKFNTFKYFIKISTIIYKKLYKRAMKKRYLLLIKK